MNKRGGTVAVVLVAAVMAVAILVFVTNFLPPGGDGGGIVELDRLLAEAQDAQIRGIKLGIMDFAEGGFSDETPRWYCNLGIPPSLDHSRDSLRTYAKQRIESYLKELEATTVEYYTEGPASITLEVDDVTDVSDLPDDATDVATEGLIVGYTEGEDVREFDASAQEITEYRVWFIYKTLYEWMEDDAGKVSTETCNLLTSPCQDRVCTCEGEVIELELNNYEITEQHVEAALVRTLLRLNELFEGTGITCAVQVIGNMTIENEMVERQVYAEGCCEEGDTSGFGLVTGCVEWDTEEAGGTDDCDFTRKQVGESVIWEYKGAPPGPSDGSGSGSATQTVAGMNRRIAVLYDVVCGDARVLVSREGGLEPTPFEARIRLRIAAQNECPPPQPCEGILECPSSTPSPLPGVECDEDGFCEPGEGGDCPDCEGPGTGPLGPIDYSKYGPISDYMEYLFA
jgi:hypothetical protein